MSEASEHRKTWRHWVSEALSRDPADSDELLTILKAASEREIVNADALNIIYGAIAVAEMRARDIMIPRAQLVTVKADAGVADFLPRVIDSGHSRFPVVGDDPDDVRGSCMPRISCRSSHRVTIRPSPSRTTSAR